jgi:hypothetical protein
MGKFAMHDSHDASARKNMPSLLFKNPMLCPLKVLPIGRRGTALSNRALNFVKMPLNFRHIRH